MRPDASKVLHAPVLNDARAVDTVDAEADDANDARANPADARSARRLRVDMTSGAVRAGRGQRERTTRTRSDSTRRDARYGGD